MLRKCIIGCALALALTAGTLAMASPPTKAIPINSVSMLSQRTLWSATLPFGAYKNIKAIADPRSLDVVSGNSTVTTHVCTDTLRKTTLPQLLSERVYTPRINVNPAQRIQSRTQSQR